MTIQLSPMFRKAMAQFIHTGTHLIAILGHLNSPIEQNKQDHMVGCLDSQYRKLYKNVAQGSERLFEDDIIKRVITINN